MTLPFVKWVGGKRRLAGKIISLFPADFNNYYEPFLGGGAVFFAAGPGLRDRAYLSDCDKDLITSYQQVRDNPDAVIELLKQHEANISKLYFLRLRSTRYSCPTKAAARLICLANSSFLGAFQKGGYDFSRKRCGPIIKNTLLAASKALQGTDIRCQGFEQIEPAPGDLVYCDPPYDNTMRPYSGDDFGRRQQRLLANMARAWDSGGVHFVISNSDTLFIRNLYRGFRIESIEIARDISGTRKGIKAMRAQEVLITNQRP